MKNRFIVFYTVLAAAVFIFSVSFFGYNLYNEYSTNLKKSEEKFTNLVSDIRTLSYNKDENNAAYSLAIKSAIGEPADYSFIHIRRSNETVVLYPSGKSKDETVSKLTKSFTTSLTVNKQNVTVDCNIYLIRPDSIFYFARISFLMILIITIITVIMIIYLNITETSSDVISLEEEDDQASEENYKEEEYPIGPEEESEDESDEEDTEITEDSPDEAPADSAELESEVEAETKTQPEPEAEEKTEEEEKSSEVTPEEVKAIFAEPLTDEQVAAEPAKLPVDEEKPSPTNDEPSGLFDPDTGIGWESYLMTRLNNEIDRATASEIDLSLFVIKLSDISHQDEKFKNVCNYLAIQFQFKDLLFEYKDDCIVAIKISMSVDEALKLADKLHSDICNIIDGKNCRIGISSRSIRMLAGDRLILESEQAIEHTDESSPVIAFRVDSEKYRQLMEKNKD